MAVTVETFKTMVVGRGWARLLKELPQCPSAEAGLNMGTTGAQHGTILDMMNVNTSGLQWAYLVSGYSDDFFLP